jgi:hypothetical protein
MVPGFLPTFSKPLMTLRKELATVLFQGNFASFLSWFFCSSRLQSGSSSSLLSPQISLNRY